MSQAEQIVEWLERCLAESKIGPIETQWHLDLIEAIRKGKWRPGSGHPAAAPFLVRDALDNPEWLAGKYYIEASYAIWTDQYRVASDGYSIESRSRINDDPWRDWRDNTFMLRFLLLPCRLVPCEEIS